MAIWLERCPWCTQTPLQPECFNVSGLGRFGFVECTHCGARCPEIRIDRKPVAEWQQAGADRWNARNGNDRPNKEPDG